MKPPTRPALLKRARDRGGSTATAQHRNAGGATHGCAVRRTGQAHQQGGQGEGQIHAGDGGRSFIRIHFDTVGRAVLDPPQASTSGALDQKNNDKSSEEVGSR